MMAQQEALETLHEAGLCDRLKVMVGRAPVKKVG
jgi:methanogenic corrinoid protein MtbC1